MNTQETKISLYCDRIIFFSLCGIVYFLPISKAIIESLSTLAIACFVIKKISQRTFLPKTEINYALFAYLGICLISVFLSSNFKISLRAFFGKTLENTALFFVVAETINSRKRIKIIVYILLLSSLLLGIDGIYQHFTHKDFIRNRPDFVLPRIYATFSSPTDFGCYLITVIPFALVNFFLKLRFRIRASLFLGLFILLFICVVFTVSRGAWFALIGEILFLCIWLKWLALFFVILAILIIFIHPYLNQYVKIRLSSFFVFLDHSSLERISIWGTAWRMFSSKPLLGVGLGTFMFNFSRFADANFTYIAYAHNCYLQMAAETGIIGLLAFLTILALFFYQGILTLSGAKRSFSWYILLGCLASILGYSIQMMVDTCFYSLDLGMLFWLILGLGIATIKLT